jgi:hypothetical protein
LSRTVEHFTRVLGAGCGQGLSRNHHALPDPAAGASRAARIFHKRTAG